MTFEAVKSLSRGICSCLGFYECTELTYCLMCSDCCDGNLCSMLTCLARVGVSLKVWLIVLECTLL